MRASHRSPYGKRHIARRCRIEPLEPRRVMAGNVTAEVINGDLIITGDDAANWIDVLHGSEPGSIRIRHAFEPTITPTPPLPGPGVILHQPDAITVPFDPGGTLLIQDQEELPRTTANDSDFGATFSGVTGSIIVRLHGGDDKVNVMLLQIGGDLVVEGGSGADQIHVGRFLTVDSTDFDESAAQDGVIVNGNVRIATGNHGDTVRMIRTTVVGDVDVRSEDALNADFTNTTMRGLSVVTDAGADRITSFNVSADTIEINTGAGDDVVMLDADVETSATIDLGTGTDLLRQRGTVAIGDLTIDAGPGADRVILGGTPASGDDGTYYWWFVSADSLHEMKRGAAGSLFVNGNLTVNTDGGDYLNAQRTRGGIFSIDSGDSVTPEFIRLRDVTAWKLYLDVGAGNDIVNAAFTTTQAGLRMDMGEGDNLLSVAIVAHEGHENEVDAREGASFTSGSGRDTIALAGVRFEFATPIETGSGDDVVSVVASLFPGRIGRVFTTIDTGDGNDLVRVEYSSVTGLHFLTGAGNDNASIQTSAVDTFFADLGLGDDRLDVVGAHIKTIADTDGGAGFDMLIRRNSRIKQFSATNFETGNDSGLVFV